MANFKRKRWVFGGAFIILMLFVFFGTFSRVHKLDLQNGGSVSVQSPSLLSTFVGAECQLSYTPHVGPRGKVILWRNLVDQPILVMQAKHGISLYCLYNYDTNFRLICVDPGQNFVSFPSNSFSCLRSVVLDTPWVVKEASFEEWQQVFDQLNNLSPDEYAHCRIPLYDFGLITLGYSQKDILATIENQITLMRKAGSNQWPIMESRR